MNNIIINKVSYNGDNFHYESPKLKNGLNIVTGANATGKTTFMNLIYFGLGGTVYMFYDDSKQKELIITEDKNAYVELSLKINNEEMIFLRKMCQKDRNFITVICSDKSPKIYYLDRRSNEFIFSDWILEKFNIPIFKLYQGVIDFTFNFTDLLRLVYHDQLSDAHQVFKLPDAKQNFVNDSSLLRKTIFEVATNNAALEFYKILNDVKLSESQIKYQQKIVESIKKNILYNTNYSEIRNPQHIKASLEEIEVKLNLQNIKINNIKSSDTKNIDQKDLEGLYMHLRELYNNKETLFREYESLNRELYDFISLQKYQEIEISNLNMIINTQEKLMIIDSEKCPICGESLSDREENHCICGKKLDEKKYQNFFYSQKDHETILYSRMKSIQTTEKSIEIIRVKIDVSKQKLDSIISEIKMLKEKINILTIESSNSKYLANAKVALEEIKELNSSKISLEKEFSMSIEHEKELKVLNDLFALKKEQMLQYEKLSIEVREKMKHIISDFSTIYNELLTTNDSSIITARINDDYEPVINNDEYVNAAVKAPRRLYYYLSLLQLSLMHEMPFPKLLLIDTPKNFGIDHDKILKIIDSLMDFELANHEKEYQIILTINKESVSEKMKPLIVYEIDTDKLLKKVS